MGSGGEGGAEAPERVLEGLEMDMTHQEHARVLARLEDIYRSAYTEWLPAGPLANMLQEELGYEDADALEDALGGTFESYLGKLGSVVETRKSEGGSLQLKLKPEPDQSAWRPQKLRFQVTDPKDLWRACLRSRHARIEIPELEFEIGCNDKRHIDSIYNHIGLAIFELGQFAKTHEDKGVQDKIYDTCISLNEYLDVAAPFHWVIHDPSGLSEVHPMDGVEVLPYEPE